MKNRSKQKKLAVVTGAARGIGKAIAQELISSGYYVVGTYNSSSQEAKQLSERYRSDLVLHRVNFLKSPEVDHFISELKGRGECIHVLVNNAGIFLAEDLTNFTLEIWDQTIRVNTTVPLYLSAALETLLKKGSSIVNISSTDAEVGAYTSLSYAASKAALNSITKSLGNTLGMKGVRVNAIAPGWIDRDMSTPESQMAVDMTPLARNGTPKDVAQLVAYLASEQASFINGAIINIDGGYSNVDYIIQKEAGL